MNEDGICRRPPRLIASAVVCMAIAVPAELPAGLAASNAAMAAERDDAAEQEPAGQDIPDGASNNDASADDAPASAGSAPSDPTDTPPDTPDEPDAAEAESEEVFVPSEDISEDIDVPFPVDI